MDESLKNWRLGIDVGGTNTDAVIVDEKLNLVASMKSPTTEDVMTGIKNAMHAVLKQIGSQKAKIGYAMLGTTHCTNAIVERKRLNKVVAIRIGAPATTAVKPMADWPDDLKTAMHVQSFIIKGGNEYDGREIAALDCEKIRDIAGVIKNSEIEPVAVTSVFSPVSDKHEKIAAAILKEELGENFPVTISSEIGNIGLLERENASILNAALVGVANTMVKSFIGALDAENIENAAVYLCQNDGTLMSVGYAKKYPILTIACGPTNSIRGAAFLTGKRNAFVVDVGGTTTDVGVLSKGFPRQSMVAVEIGEVRTNFRMPDLVSIGLGGGTIIKVGENGEISIGPESVGFHVTEKAICFGGDTLTATDVVVGLGMVHGIGDQTKTEQLDKDILEKAYIKMQAMVEKCIDTMKTVPGNVDVILVGGGNILISGNLTGVEKIYRPQNLAVANAIGSAIAQVSGQVEKVFSLKNITKENALQTAKDLAVQEAKKAGANGSTIEITDVEYVPLAYLSDAVKIRVKAVGNLQL